MNTENKTKRKTILFIAVSVIIFAVFDYMILQKERILDKGQTILLELAPRDPRSLIQGDYMVLRYKIATERAGKLIEGKTREGKIVLKLDENNVGKFVRVHGGEALTPGEKLLNYKHRYGLRFGAESFFFQEGHAKYYTRARYGELKVAPNGESVLVGLQDKDFNQLGPESEQPISDQTEN